MENHFYVYELVDPRNGETFYVGKGCGRRAWQHKRLAHRGAGANAAKIKRIQEITAAGFDVEIRMVETNLTEVEALDREVAEIGARIGLVNAGRYAGRLSGVAGERRRLRARVVEALAFLRGMKTPKRFDLECQLLALRGQKDEAAYRWECYVGVYETMLADAQCGLGRLRVLPAV